MNPEMITLAESEAIVVGALAKAAELACSPLSVAVLDAGGHLVAFRRQDRSEEHTSELQSLMRISYAVFCLKKKINNRVQILITCINRSISHELQSKLTLLP